MLALISGGGSALLVQPAGAITLAEKQAVNDALLASGAPIGEMNIVRKHLSPREGRPARGRRMARPDAGADDLGHPRRRPRAHRFRPDGGRRLHRPPTPARSSTAGTSPCRPPSRRCSPPPTGVLPPDAPALARTENRVIAAPAQSLAAAAAQAEAAGCEVRILGDALEGEAREVAADQARLAREIQAAAARPVLLLSGGECTVTRRGDGVGGPNAEFCLGLAVALGGAPGICGLACDTDGVDGAAEVAGAIVTPDTLARAAKRRDRSDRGACTERRPRLLRGHRRSGRYRADPDECERLPRNPRSSRHR